MSKKKYNVMSLFNGMSFGRMALESQVIKVNKYYSSEIDKHANKVTDLLFPDTIQLGDIENWNNWDIDFSKIDLLIAGFPCQAWSMAGNQEGDNDPRGALVHVLIEIWETIQLHNYDVKFMFENVKMKTAHLNYVNYLFEVQPVCINSALVSAQNRVRYYWTNIGQKVDNPTFNSWIELEKEFGGTKEKYDELYPHHVKQPEDRNINLADILERDLPSCGLGGRITGRRLNELGKREDYNYDIPISQYLEIRVDNKSNCLTTVYKDSVVPYFKLDRRFKIKFNQGKSSCLSGGARGDGNHSDMDILVIDPDVCRRYSLREECRLQTVPEKYIDTILNSGVSNTQLHKMLANGWTHDVIVHIFKEL